MSQCLTVAVNCDSQSELPALALLKNVTAPGSVSWFSGHTAILGLGGVMLFAMLVRRWMHLANVSGETIFPLDFGLIAIMMTIYLMTLRSMSMRLLYRSVVRLRPLRWMSGRDSLFRMIAMGPNALLCPRLFNRVSEFHRKRGELFPDVSEG